MPVLVGGLLASHYADTLACGTSHVAVVATQRGKANAAGGGSGPLGSSSSSSSVTRLLTWGQNNRGQLGIGAAREDHLLPQVGCRDFGCLRVLFFFDILLSAGLLVAGVRCHMIPPSLHLAAAALPNAQTVSVSRRRIRLQRV